MPPNNVPKDWFDYVSALTPIFVALFVAFVSYRQWRVAREKLRLDLYHRRFAVFEITLRFYEELLGGKSIPEEELQSLHRKYITAMIEAKFLFSKTSSVHKLMNDFNKSAFIIKGSRDVMHTPDTLPELVSKAHSQLITEQLELENKLAAIETAMAPYLYFGGTTE